MTTTPETWPYTFHPARYEGDQLVPDTSTVVTVFQHRPDLTEQLVAWCGGFEVFVNGGPAVILPGGGGVVGLGDFAVRGLYGLSAEPADGFYQRYIPA